MTRTYGQGRTASAVRPSGRTRPLGGRCCWAGAVAAPEPCPWHPGPLTRVHVHGTSDPCILLWSADRLPVGCYDRQPQAKARREPSSPAVAGALLGLVITASSALVGYGFWLLYAVVGPWLH